MKPGYKTTEFWLALVGQLLSVLILLGIITHADAELLGGAVGQIVTAVFVVLGQTSVLLTYIKARTFLKLPQQPIEDDEDTDHVQLA